MGFERATPHERAVAAVLGSVLGAAVVDLDVDFGSLGGDEHRAPDALTQLCDVFRVELSSEVLNPSATARTVAAAIEVARAGARAAASQQPVKALARNTIEEALVGIFSNVLAVTDVGVDDDFFDLGGDEPLAVRVVTEIESLFAVALPVRVLLEHATPARLAPLVRVALLPADEPAFTYCLDRGTGDPLFCLVVWLRGIPQFQRLARHLDVGRPIYSVLSQRIAEDRPPLQHVDDMAALAVQRLRSVQPKGPYSLVGYSLGAAVALEAAQLLVAAGDDVTALVLIDAALPPAPRPWPARWLHTALHSSRAETRDAARRVVRRTAASWFPRRAQGAASDVVDQLWTLDAANRRAWMQYQPRPWPGDALLLRTAESDHDRGGDTLRWDRVVRGRLQVEVVPGTHESVLSEPNVAAVAEAMNRALAVRP